MGYAISIGSGLAVGIGLMIWALIERSKRAKAESAAVQADRDREASIKIAEENARIVEQIKEVNQKLEEQIEVIRERLRAAREQLIKMGDIELIGSWLDDELNRDKL